MTTTDEADCGGYEPLPWDEVPSAIAHELQQVLSPLLVEFAELKRNPAPVRVAPSGRFSTYLVEIPTTVTVGAPIPLLPAEPARARVTIVAAYKVPVGAVADAAPTLVYLYPDSREAGSSSYGFPIATGGASVAASAAAAPSAPFVLATTAAVVLGVRTAPPATLVVAALSEYVDLEGGQG